MSDLCYKDEVVLTLHNENGKPVSISKIVNPELLPIPLKRDCSSEKFFEWLSKRSMPSSREGLAEVKAKFGESWLNENIHYASLNDHYWLRKRQEKWRSVSYFQVRFPLEIGNMFFSPWEVNTKAIHESPDLTTGGVLKKRWRQYQGKNPPSYLLKAGSLAARQEPLNEVLVSVLCEKLKIIDCVRYELATEGMIMCSKCDNFVTVDTDFVMAKDIYYDEPRTGDESVYAHLLRMCEKFDIPNAEEHIDGILFIDSITGNEDRNLSNIGFIRDAKTMKFIGCAPLFDSGNAYWNSKLVTETTKSKMFGDVEKRIYTKMVKKVNLEPLCSEDYVDIIVKYPEITDNKKDKLIEAIKKKNAFLMIEQRESSKDAR